MPRVFDLLITPGSAAAGTLPVGEPEILAARRAFGKAQELLAGEPINAGQALATGWYDSSVHPESGCFALVRTGAGQDGLVGEVVRVALVGRLVYAYVLQASSLPETVDIALTRRAFASICRLSIESVVCDVVAVAG